MLLAFLPQFSPQAPALEQSLEVWFHSLGNPPWADTLFVAASDPKTALILVPIAFWYGWKGGPEARRNLLVAMLVLAATDLLSGVVLKNAFPRIRPNGKTFSFPSSHSANATGQAAFFSSRHPRYSALFVAPALLVSLSRLALYKHWPSDVLASLVLGTVIGISADQLLRYFLSRGVTEQDGAPPSAS